MKLRSALEKITAMKGVRAAFVCNGFQEILVRAVPEQYPDLILKHIASQIHQIITAGWAKGFFAKEFRLGYPQNAIHVRLISENNYLILFTDAHVQTADLRPAVNLAVLVLDKMLRTSGDSEEDLSLRAMAEQAEETLKTLTARDKSFAGDFRRLCFDYYGPLGGEVVDDAIEVNVMSVPMLSETQMRQLIDYALTHLPHASKRATLYHETQVLLARKVKELR
jgi:hypothetical protein